MQKMSEATDGNVYETTMVIAKRANQIAADLKREMQKKMKEYVVEDDSLEEVFENPDQIAISEYYERMPKPTLIAVQEYEDGEVYHKNPVKDKDALL